MADDNLGTRNIGDLREMALIGSVDQISENVGVLAHPQRTWRVVRGALEAE